MALSAAEKGICLENLSHPRLLEGGARRGAVGGVAQSATVFQAYTLRSEATDECERDARSRPGMTKPGAQRTMGWPQNASIRPMTHSVARKGGGSADSWTQDAPGRPKSHSVSSGEDFRTATGIESTTVIPCLAPIIPYSTIRRPPLDNRHFLPLVMTLAPLESRFDPESRHNRRMLTKQFLDSVQNNSSTSNIYKTDCIYY